MYDVFLSHNHNDKNEVTKIANILCENKICVWLDEWNITPGDSFILKMSDALNNSKSCAIFYGEETPQGWFSQEIERALNIKSKNNKFRIIPILLPSASLDKINDFVEQLSWIKFKNLKDKKAIYLLICAIKGMIPGEYKENKLIMNDDDNSNENNVIITTQNVDIEIKIDIPFNEFSNKRKQELIFAIEKILDIPGNINIKKIERGSVKITFELRADLAEKLKWMIKSGELNYLDIIDAEVIELNASKIIGLPDHFKNLTSEQLSLVYSNLKVYQYNNKEIIFNQTTSSSHLMFVKSGLVKIYRELTNGKFIILKIAKPNDFIGLHSIFNNSMHTYSASALADASIVSIEHKLFNRLLKINNDFSYSLMKELNYDFLYTFNKLSSHSSKQLPGRIAEMILYFANKIFKSEEFNLPLTRRELAEFVGTSKEKAFSVLFELKNDNIIDLNGNHIKIISMKILRTLSELG